MTHLINPNLLRIHYSRLWSNKWCNDLNFSHLVVEDLRMRYLAIDFFKTLPINVFDIKIIRVSKKIFLIVHGMINPRKFKIQEEGEEEESEKLVYIYSYFFLPLFELKKQILDSFSYPDVHIFYRFLYFGWFRHKDFSKFLYLRNAKNLALLFSSSFRKKRRKPIKHMLGLAKAFFKKKKLRFHKFYGAKVRLSGPLGAPRNRRHRNVTLSFGDMPINSFQSYVEFYRTTAVNKFGSFGIKVWLFKGSKSLLASGNKHRRWSFPLFTKKSFYAYATNYWDVERTYIYRYIVE